MLSPSVTPIFGQQGCTTARSTAVVSTEKHECYERGSTFSSTIVFLSALGGQPPELKDVGCRSNFDPSRPLYTQDTSFSVKSSLTAVRQGAKVPSSDIFA